MTTETVRVASVTEADAEAMDVAQGRSLWSDALHRFMRNRAAVTSIVILLVIVVFTFVGPFFSSWSIEKIDWGILGIVADQGGPSIQSGHYFGADELGRDL
jgi:oligopeptide transport system permease protein